METLLPIYLAPAFRHGKDTPWGGDQLQTVFHKKIPDHTTGESLEVSVLEGLNSADENGVTLTALIDKHGESLLGKHYAQPFPLLLKLIDAREALSVQVHPDDAYAAVNENGKLGKEEAWVVLKAEEGVRLVYGIQKGISKETIRQALEKGEGMEECLRYVPVKAFDVLFIPAGCVHAIGGGILLYEIQQSSDVTYRFYDYNRTDAKGNKRELHVDKALAVCDTNFALDTISAPTEAGISRLLDTQRFILDIANVNGELTLQRAQTYAFLTATDDLTLVCDGREKTFQKGQTALLPHTCPPVTLKGKGRALIAMPPKEV